MNGSKFFVNLEIIYAWALKTDQLRTALDHSDVTVGVQQMVLK